MKLAIKANAKQNKAYTSLQSLQTKNVDQKKSPNGLQSLDWIVCLQ